MESTTKKVILPTKGICNASPDKICDDTELLDSVGLTYFNDALRPIQSPEPIGNLARGVLKYVHRINDGLNVNYISATGAALYNGTLQIGSSLPSDISNVTAVGNTLIVSTKSDGIYYYLWKSGSYISLGDTLPDFNIRFAVRQHGKKTKLGTYDNYYEKSCLIDGILDNDEATATAITMIEGKHDDAVNAVVGLYSEMKTKIHHDKKFCNPFLAIAVLELYDGTYVKHTNPILLMPAVHRNSSMFVAVSTTGDEGTDGLYMRTIASDLIYWLEADFTDWKDIIRGVDIFISDEIEVNDTDLSNYITSNLTAFPDFASSDYEDGDIVIGKIYDAVSEAYPWWDSKYTYITQAFKTASELEGDYTSPTNEYTPFPRRSDADIIADICNARVFYKLCEIPYSASNGTSYVLASKFVKSGVVENITTQEQLNVVDFYSHCSLTPEYSATYNRRLNIARIERSFYSGFKHFSGYTTTSLTTETTNYKITVTIETPSGRKTVYRQFLSSELFYENMWFFYPDPRATHVKIVSGSTVIVDADLVEHRGLNGAYYIGDTLPYGSETPSSLSTDTETGNSENVTETLNNYLLQSEVDNPFTFLAAGYVRVGQGNILATAGLTTGLTQDAYKVSTTIVFTTQGIWAITINDDGSYKAVAPPFSREVLYHYYDSSNILHISDVCIVDNAVYFISEKGLMLITDDGIQCVSSHLAGKNPDSDVYSIILGTDTTYADFLTFLKDCKIAYDYRDSQLIITNSDFAYHWVYNIKTGTFSRFVDGNIYQAVVGDYPDFLLQRNDGLIHSLINEPNINADENKYSATLITRPMKFEESVKLKTIRELLHIDDLHEITTTEDNITTTDKATISIKIYGSNDCRTWQEIQSLHGRGFKFFIFRYDFANLLAYDSFAGSIIGYDTRETDKLR